jgi:hypothetical protein
MSEKKKSSEVRVLAPRLVPLSAAQEREAVGLLAGLLLEVARERRGGVLGCAFDGGSGGVIGGVVQLPGERGNAREVA